MENVAVTPERGQLIVDIEDVSMAKDLRRAISLFRGVRKVSTPRRPRMTGYSNNKKMGK